MNTTSDFLGHPKGLFVCFATEMWERFSYYGMRALLILYLTKHWEFTDATSYLIYGAYTSLVYIMPVFGGMLADQILGSKKAVTYGAILLVFGHLGMTVENMSAEHHDRVLAMTSHIPQLIAYSIVATSTELESKIKKEVIKYSAAGFRDFTRLAGSDPIMWRDIYMLNKDAVLEMLGRFSEDLSSLQKAIRNSDSNFLEKMFSETREVRKQIEKFGQAGTFDPREKNN